MRTIAIVLAITLTTLASAQTEPTHFRKHHALLVHGLPGEAITLHIPAIRASLGYPDALAWRLLARLNAPSAHEAVNLNCGTVYALVAPAPASLEIGLAAGDATVVQVTKP